MRPQERKLCSGVVEPIDVRPGLCRVARFASEGRPIRSFVRHALVELALVRVLVASRARAVLKMERQDLVRAPAGSQFVAIAAGDRDVRSREGETCVAMFGDAERRLMELLHRVAAFALVVIRRGRELIVVGILVAIAAEFKLHLVKGVFARGDVALCAVNRDVLSRQWVLGGGVLLDTEE